MELLRMDGAIDELITRNASLGELSAHALAQGFSPIAEDGLRRVLEGDQHRGSGPGGGP